MMMVPYPLIKMTDVALESIPQSVEYCNRSMDSLDCFSSVDFFSGGRLQVIADSDVGF